MDHYNLLAQAQAGDRKAFEAVVESHRNRLEAFVQTRLGPELRQRTEPDDILQETFMRAFQSLTRFEWQGEDSFFSWLAAIAEFVIRDLGRATRRVPRAGLLRDPRGEDPSPSTTLRRGERFDRLTKALETLSGEHREVVRLARIEGIPINEIAARMQRTPGAIRHLLLRALEKLRASFGEETESFSLPGKSLTEGEGNGDAE